MATNSYFNRINRASEQDLFEDLVIEMIQMNGVDVVFIPREEFVLDPILKEPKKTVFRRNYTVEAYMSDGGQYEGEQNIQSAFGFRVDQTTEFHISKKRFSQLGTGLLRPREGDLIFLGNPDDPHGSYTNSMFEINQCWYQTPDWQFGKHYTYRLVCSTFTGSYEKFETGRVGPDGMNIANEDEVKTGINAEVIEEKQSLINWDVKNPFGDF